MAKQMTDLKRDNTGDLDLSSGDIQWVESTEQHQKDIILAKPGDYPLSPPLGVDLEHYIEGNDNGQSLKQAINRHFTADGMTVNQIILSGDNIDIDAEY